MVQENIQYPAAERIGNSREEGVGGGGGGRVLKTQKALYEAKLEFPDG